MLTQLQGSVVLVRALFLTTVFHLLFTTGYGLLLCFAPTQEPGGETYSRWMPMGDSTPPKSGSSLKSG